MWILFDVASIALLLSLVLTPLVRRAGERFGLVDRPDVTRKLHANPVPRLGGIAVFAAYVLALLFVVVAPYRNVTIDIPLALSGAAALAPAAFLMFGVGLLDDIIGLKPWQKLIGQIMAAVLAYFGGFGIHVLRDHPLELWVSLPVSVFWLVACANALNMIDGIDGLAAGVGFFASATTLVAALTHGNIPLAIVTAPLCASLLGFLRYNFNPASIFLGDCVSLLVGFLLGCYGALWSHKSATILGMTAPLMALAIPLMDVCIAVLRRFIRKQPIFGADRGHIHHRLLDQGLTPRRAALILYAVCGIAAVLSLLQDIGQDNCFHGLVILLFCGVTWLGVQNLGYAEFNIAGKVIFQRGLRRTIAAQMCLQEFERDLTRASNVEEVWTVLVSASQMAGFSCVHMESADRAWDSRATAHDPKSAWELRIPLLPSSSVTLYRESHIPMHPLLMSGFAEVIQRQLVHRLTPCHLGVVARWSHGGDQHTSAMIPTPMA